MPEILQSQKKAVCDPKIRVVEGISKMIRGDFEKIIQQIENDNRRRNEEAKEDQATLCQLIEELSVTVNNCYSLFIGDKHPLVVSNRNPIVLVKYTRLFLECLLEMRKKQDEERRMKKIQNETKAAVYNQNNIYELLAKKNIEFMALESQINDLKLKLELSTRRSVVAEEMTAVVKQRSDEMLKVYRDNFITITNLLQLAEQKQTELLQSNRFLNEEIQNSNLEFEMYKKNYKIKILSKDSESRLRERLEKEFEERIRLITRQMEYQKKSQNIR